jgi:circadian clock protein KaiC
VVAKLPTGIEGLDQITEGGLPLGRSTLISGTAGSAKTVLATQFLVAGIRNYGQSGVFVTFEEPAEDLRKNMLSFGWDLAAFEAEQRLAFVDAAPGEHDLSESEVTGSYDFGAIQARIEHAVRKTKAQRAAIDSIGSVFTRFENPSIVRRELLRIFRALRGLGLTTLVTIERASDAGSIGRHGVEEFVADNVILLGNSLEQEKRRRTIEILKFRGTTHQKGEFSFTITPEDGLIVLPLSALELKQGSTNLRITSGNSDLDNMCGGGFFRDSVILGSGPTGTGKTLITTHFIAGGVEQGERSLLFAFEESRDQLYRNANGWGVNLDELEKTGRLRVVCVYPESHTLEDHLLRLKKEMAAFRPQRIAVDSLTALERVSTEKSFREFVIGLTAYVKAREMAGLFTATTVDLLGGSSVTESHISTITDSIILLRYVELHGEMRRGIVVLKMRGSRHDKEIREITIDHQGMHIGQPFRTVSGILTGRTTHVGGPSEVDRVAGLFGQEGTNLGNAATP